MSPTRGHDPFILQRGVEDDAPMTGYGGRHAPFDRHAEVETAVPERSADAAASVDLSTSPSDNDALALVPEAYATANDLIPLEVRDGVLSIACADPGDAAILSEVQVLSRHRVRALAAPRAEIHEAIRQRYKVLPHVDERTALQSINEQSPIVNVVNIIIAQGLRDRASDIHLEPQQTHLRVRFRIDGILTDA